MNLWRWIFIAFIISLNAMAYRYVCNGFLANGEERTDECGVCDDEHAARWSNANIPVTVDDSPLPEGLNQGDWQKVVKKSMEAWNNIEGSSLRFFTSSQANLREFGANELNHEIFWITEKEEWRRLVGTGEFGTLGATLPRYVCGGDLGAKRKIFDADLVLNGLPHINWQVDCNDDDCISIQTTLVHELGHFFGLDHPCLICDTSIMSARAGYDLVYPVLDDIAGIRALYPDGSLGKFGASCIDDSSCASENYCISHENNKYCSHSCLNDKDCQEGAFCQRVDGRDSCIFVAGGANARELGESCTRVACKEPYVCAGASSNFYCFESCQNVSDCPDEQRCVSLQNDVSLCVTIKALGEVCSDRELCEENLFCVLGENNKGSCRALCDDESQCPQGQRCQKFPEGPSLCLDESDGSLNLDNLSSGFGDNLAEENLGRDKIQDNNQQGCNQGSAGVYPLLCTFVLALWRSFRIRSST